MHMDTVHAEQEGIPQDGVLPDSVSGNNQEASLARRSKGGPRTGSSLNTSGLLCLHKVHLEKLALHPLILSSRCIHIIILQPQLLQPSCGLACRQSALIEAPYMHLSSHDAQEPQLRHCEAERCVARM